MQPRQSRETVTPVRPRVVYFMASLQPSREPGVDFTVPVLRVLTLEDPVILVRVVDEPRGDPFRRERAVELEALPDGHAVVALAMEDEDRRLERGRVTVRAPLLDVVAVREGRAAVAVLPAVRG